MAQISISDYFDDDDDDDDDEEEEPTFDIAEGRRRRDEGMSQADQARGRQDWRRRAELWLDAQPIGAEIYSDLMVRSIGLPPGPMPYGRNILGARFGAWVKVGRIAKTGRTYTPERPESHSRGGDHPIYRKVK